MGIKVAFTNAGIHFCGRAWEEYSYVQKQEHVGQGTENDISAQSALDSRD